MSETYDVIVVGVGAMGSAACYQLAKRGVKVLGLDRFSIPNALASSHGESRMIRLCYYEHPDYVPLLKRAYELWAELEEESGEKLLHITGGIYIGTAECEFITSTIHAATKYDLPHQFLNRRELHKRFPMFHVPDDYAGIYEPNAGILLPERIVATHAELALIHGAVLHGHEPVTEWSHDETGVTVKTARGTYRAGQVIFCAGAWSEQILGEVGVELKVTRQVIGWVQPNKPEVFTLGSFPVWAIANPDQSLHYGFPIMPGRPGLKIAHHFAGEPTTAGGIDRVAHSSDEDDFRPTLERYLPDANGPLLSMLVCMYTNTPDAHFVLDRHPNCHRAIIACGFSGHGFKFASVFGEALAELAQNGKTRHPIDFLGLKRFR